jgi:membrane fusion protein (multidrug efflux system)
MLWNFTRRSISPYLLFELIKRKLYLEPDLFHTRNLTTFMKNNHMNFAVKIVLLGFIIMLSNCSKKEAGQAPPPEVEVIQVLQKDVPIFREFVGQAFGLEDIPIRARVEGFLEEIAFDEGTRVSKGQLLYRIDAQPFMQEVAAQQSRVAEAETYLVNATNELRRYEPLVKINAVSQSDYDAALASKEAAEASLKAAEANLEMARINLSYTRILAPIDGLIGKTNARVGEFVGRSPNPVILNTVSRISTIRVQFFLPETAYLTLARMADMDNVETPPDDRNERANVELILADGTLYSEKGNIDFIDRNVDIGTGSLLVQASFPNPDRILRPGMYTKVKLEMTNLEGALLVPQRCVTELQGQYSVFVVDAENMVQTRQIKASEKIGDLWLVDEGLTPDDRVIVTGIQTVAAGITVNPTLVEFQSQTNQ